MTLLHPRQTLPPNGIGEATPSPRVSAGRVHLRWDCSSRTMQVAHLYIEEHFAKLNSGDVVDVEFIMGLTKQPKISERYDKET